MKIEVKDSDLKHLTVPYHTLPEDMQPGDVVRLTGADWDEFGIRNAVVEITGTYDGDPVFEHPTSSTGYSIYTNDEDGDYSATKEI